MIKQKQHFVTFIPCLNQNLFAVRAFSGKRADLPPLYYKQLLSEKEGEKQRGH